MKINPEIFTNTQKTESKILVVTKYHNELETQEIMEFCNEKYPEIIEWFWENRVEDMKTKNIPRELCHFIGNIQTKEIKHITQLCSVIHSVDNIKHIKKIEDICEKQNNWIEIYLQIKLDENKPGGITLEEVPDLLEFIWDLVNVSLVWFSGIWKTEATDEERKNEFQILLDLRTRYLQNGFVSAGTSRDYKLALEMWVDIVRVWKALFE